METIYILVSIIWGIIAVRTHYIKDEETTKWGYVKLFLFNMLLMPISMVLVLLEIDKTDEIEDYSFESIVSEMMVQTEDERKWSIVSVDGFGLSRNRYEDEVQKMLYKIRDKEIIMEDEKHGNTPHYKVAYIN